MSGQGGQSGHQNANQSTFKPTTLIFAIQFVFKRLTNIRVRNTYTYMPLSFGEAVEVLDTVNKPDKFLHSILLSIYSMNALSLTPTLEADQEMEISMRPIQTPCKDGYCSHLPRTHGSLLEMSIIAFILLPLVHHPPAICESGASRWFF